MAKISALPASAVTLVGTAAEEEVETGEKRATC